MRVRWEAAQQQPRMDVNSRMACRNVIRSASGGASALRAFADDGFHRILGGLTPNRSPQVCVTFSQSGSVASECQFLREVFSDQFGVVGPEFFPVGRFRRF